MEQYSNNDDLLLNVREAADFLRMSRMKLYRLMKSGDIVGRKVGATWVFYKRDLIEYVDNAPTSRELYAKK